MRGLLLWVAELDVPEDIIAELLDGAIMEDEVDEVDVDGATMEVEANDVVEDDVDDVVDDVVDDTTDEEAEELALPGEAARGVKRLPAT